MLWWALGWGVLGVFLGGGWVIEIEGGRGRCGALELGFSL